MTATIHTLVVSSFTQQRVSGLLKETIRSQAGFSLPQVISPDKAAAELRKSRPDWVIVLLSKDNLEQTLVLVERLREIHTGQLLVVGPASDSKPILRSMQAGADRYLDEDDLEAEWVTAIDRILSSRRGEPRSGDLFVVVSASGGCGASTVAVNLAAVAATAHGQCNLIDLNTGKSDLAPLLDLKPRYTLLDLCRHDDRMDRSMYEKLLARHPKGIALLAAPQEYEDAPLVTAKGVSRAVALGRESFPVVVVDLKDCFHEEQAAVLHLATKIFLVCRLDFTAVRNTRRILQHLASRNISRDRVELVVNKAGLPKELPVPEAEACIGGKLSHFIPHDPATIFTANNTGVPAAYSNPNGAVVQSIARLVGLEDPSSNSIGVAERVRGWIRNIIHPAAGIPEVPKQSTTPTPIPAALIETRLAHETIITPRFAPLEHSKCSA